MSVTKPRLTAAVISMIGPALAEHGFALAESDSSSVWFTRSHRGFWNRILVCKHPLMVDSFTYSLRAPKKPQGDVTRQAPIWSYTSHEELLERLAALRSVLLDEGLTWLDLYTPGNVPAWEEYASQFVTPLVTGRGIPLADSRLPDILFYRTADLHHLVTLDLQMPGVARVLLHRRMSDLVGYCERNSPDFRYNGAETLKSSIMEVAQFLDREGLHWVLQAPADDE